MALTAKFWLRVLAVVLGLVATGLALTRLGWPALKSHYGIEHLQWQGLRLGPRQLRIEHLQLSQRSADGSQLRADAQDILLQWRWSALALQQLTARQLRLDWQPAANPPVAPSPWRMPEIASDLPPWLPQHLQVQAFALSLPCASGRCALSGGFEAQRPETLASPWHLALTLDHLDRQLSVDADLTQNPSATQLDARVGLDQQPRLQLHSRWQTQQGASHWSGELALPELPESAWLLAWLEQWLGPQPRLNQAPDLQLHGNWQLQWPAGHQPSFSEASGHLNLRGQLPVAWPLPEIGQLQGQWAITLSANQGAWQARQVQADLSLSAIAPQLLSALPPELRPQSLHLRLEPDPDATPINSSALPLQLWLSTAGNLKLEAQARLQWLADPAGWALQVAQSRWQAALSQFSLEGVAAQGVQADVQLSGHLNAQGADITLAPDARLALERLDTGEVSLRHARLSSGAMLASLRLAPQAATAFQLQGPLRLEVQSVQQAQLLPLRWDWQGQLQADSERIDAQGTLTNGSGLVAQLDGQRLASGALHLRGRLQEVFLRTGNPLAATLKAWPPLLELNNGRLRLSADYNQPAKGQAGATAELQLQGVAGLYDRSELQGLSGTLQAQLAGDALQLKLGQTRLDRLDSGIGLGPLTLDSAQYVARLGSLSQGQLTWGSLSSAFLGGRLWLDPGSWQLAQDSPALPLHIEGLQLEELLRAYPAEGLSGQGALDGTLPLSIGAQGVRISAGTLAARDPGGVLVFASPRISALGQSNPAMKLVAEALGNFHYSHLSSGVSYDQQGKLLLDLRLEGRNPDLEGGRPINFNINLEEDIPALLTSLQLTDRVSERVRQRVQDRLSRPETSAP